MQSVAALILILKSKSNAHKVLKLLISALDITVKSNIMSSIDKTFLEDLIKSDGYKYVEVYCFSFNDGQYGTDNLTPICEFSLVDGKYHVYEILEKLPFDEEGNIEASFCKLDEETYNQLILNNTSVVFSDFYNDDDKVLGIFLSREYLNDPKVINLINEVGF